MNILYDNIIFELQKSGGISLYWSELIKRHLVNPDINISFVETSANTTENIFRQRLNLPHIQTGRSWAGLPQIIQRYLSVAQQSGTSVFHSSYYRKPRQKGVNSRHIVTVHDFIYEQYVTGVRQSIHSWQKYKALAKADGIICVSESTKADLLKIHPQFRGKSIKVIYNGVSDVFRQVGIDESRLFLEHSYQLCSPFVLYVGARTSSYKNFDFAVKAISRDKNYKLILVGGGNLNSSELALLNRELKGRYLHLQYIPQAHLNMLYNVAHCLLYPSSYEGFGLPLIEAQSAGCPIIAGNNSSISEVVKSKSCLLDKMSADGIAAMIKAMESSGFRQQIIDDGLLHSRQFSWDDCYEETMMFYNEVCEATIAEAPSLS